jgi:hypothetical protein
LVPHRRAAHANANEHAEEHQPCIRWRERCQDRSRAEDDAHRAQEHSASEPVGGLAAEKRTDQGAKY